jgi:hypothetical protein
MTKPNDPVLTSDTFTSLKENLTKQRVSAAHWRDETWRFTKLLAPVSCYDETSETIWDPGIATVARIGLLITTQKKEAASAGDYNEAARREDAIKKTLAGEALVTPVSIREESETATRRTRPSPKTLPAKNFKPSRIGLKLANTGRMFNAMIGPGTWSGKFSTLALRKAR